MTGYVFDAANILNLLGLDNAGFPVVQVASKHIAGHKDGR